jgi:hypothetical protein
VFLSGNQKIDKEWKVRNNFRSKDREVERKVKTKKWNENCGKVKLKSWSREMANSIIQHTKCCCLSRMTDLEFMA